MSALRRFVSLPLVFALVATVAPAQDGSSPLDQFPWVDGPATGDLRCAQIDVLEGDRFLPAGPTRKLLELMENPTSGTEVGLIGPADLSWFAVFEFEDSGYVKDDEKAELDADEIFDSLKDGNDAANDEREKRGWGTIELVGWVTPPHYDDATHNLEWATKARADGQLTVNHNTRLLGRAGVMSVTLVCAPEDLDAVLPIYRERLDGFTFKPGQRYTEFKAGDKVAAYGLTALVAGGAGAFAAKSGLLGKLWKAAVAGIIALIGFAKKLFGGKSPTPSPAAASAAPSSPHAPAPRPLAQPISLQQQTPPADRDAA